MSNINSKKKISKVSDVPANQIKTMQNYAAELHRSHPTWSPEIVAKKVCSRFNIKLDHSGKFRDNSKSDTNSRAADTTES